MLTVTTIHNKSWTRIKFGEQFIKFSSWSRGFGSSTNNVEFKLFLQFLSGMNSESHTATSINCHIPDIYIHANWGLPVSNLVSHPKCTGKGCLVLQSTTLLISSDCLLIEERVRQPLHTQAKTLQKHRFQNHGCHLYINMIPKLVGCKVWKTF